MMDAGVLYIRQELLVLYLLLDEKGAIALRYTIHLLNPLGKKKEVSRAQIRLIQNTQCLTHAGSS